MQQMSDLARKLEQTNENMSGRMGGYYGDRKKNDESQLSKATKDRYETNFIKMLTFPRELTDVFVQHQDHRRGHERHVIASAKGSRVQSVQRCITGLCQRHESANNKEKKFCVAFL